MFSSYTERLMRPLVYSVAEVSVGIPHRGTLQVVALTCIPFSVPDCIVGWVLVRLHFSLTISQICTVYYLPIWQVGFINLINSILFSTKPTVSIYCIIITSDGLTFTVTLVNIHIFSGLLKKSQPNMLTEMKATKL